LTGRVFIYEATATGPSEDKDRGRLLKRGGFVAFSSAIAPVFAAITRWQTHWSAGAENLLDGQFPRRQPIRFLQTAGRLSPHQQVIPV
jgi:hypothetical protein